MKKFLLILLILVIAFFAFCYYLGSNVGEESNVDEESNVGEKYGANLGNYDVKVLSYEITDEYSDGPVLIVKIRFTNYSSTPKSFRDVIGTNIYQNNVGLSAYHMYNNDYTAKLRNGASMELELGMLLRDTTPPVNLEFQVQGTNKKTSTTINISELSK